MPIRPSNPVRNGYALVEALIALAIMAIITALFFQTVQSTFAAQKHLSDKQMAMLIAQSGLDAALAPGSETAGVASGQDGRFRWETRFSETVANARTDVAVETVTVRVYRIGDSRTSATLSGVRVAR